MMFIKFQQGQACFAQHNANTSTQFISHLAHPLLSSFTLTGRGKLLQLMSKSLLLLPAAVLVWLFRNLTHFLL